MGKAVSKTTKEDVQLPRTYEEEVYCAAWAVVLARHGGDEDAGEVSFGCANGASQGSLRTLRLAFSAETEIGSFLRNVGQALKTLPSAEPVSNKSLPRLLPFPSILRVRTSAAPSDTSLDGAVDITYAAGEQSPTISASNAAGSAHVDILVAHLEQAVLQLRTLPPATPLREVDIFSAVDRQHLLRWNREPPPRVDETLCDLFLRQVRLRPSAPAVCAWDRDLSYAELDGLSEKLAGELVRRGVGAQEAVALCFDKSALAVVAMVAVLRAGASFVHLGISTPTQRQAAILAASQATLLVVDKSNAGSLVDHPSVPTLVVDDRSIAALPGPTTPLPVAETHHAAALTFTSGSTGTPKGIMVEHGSIATSCDAMSSRLDLGPHSRVLQFASYTFDASVGDIFYALARGACICTPSEQERVDDLAAVARRMQVNWAFLTPSVLSLLEPRDIPSLRRLLLGGEPPSPKHVATWAKSVSLHLVMGPAECAIYCAASEAILPGQAPSTFGRAAGCRLWVVDPRDHTKLAPVGCPGELVVEGRIVARGYLNDVERTRQAFLEDAPWLPSSPSPLPRRLYKSGDLVRFNVDHGTFSFVARKDNQVKLHGQRVELGEIEHHLKDAVPDVDSAIALLNTSAEHTSRHPLIVFLVFARDSTAVHHVEGPVISLTPQGTDMLRGARTQLATVLPAYMIPTLFIPLHHVPFTASGKRDAARLRHIAQGLSHEQLQTFSLSYEAAARSMYPQEERLRDLWVQVLHINPSDLGPDSDFIRQGGDSLAAMHLVAAATKVGIHLPVSTAMRHPRLSDMASEMSLLSSQPQEPAPDPFSLLPSILDVTLLKTRCADICKVGVDQIDDIYPITPLQEMLFTAALRRPGTYILCMTFQLPPSVLLHNFMSAWDQVLRSVDILRTRIVSDPHAGLLQIVVKTFEWDLYDTVQEYENENDYAAMGLGSRLARLAIIRTSPSETPIFVFAAHHAIYDAFALNIVFEQVAQICHTGECTTLSPFKNYVAYINRLPSTPSMEFWKAILDGSPVTTWPPSSRDGSQGNAIIRRHVPIPFRPTEFTLAVFAQAAFTLLFSVQTGSDDVVFGISGSGRDAALNNIINTPGPTLYTIPFRTRIDRSISLGSFLDSIRQAIFQRAQYGHVGLPQIRRASPDAAQACDFRCIFAVQPRHLEVPEAVFGSRLSFTEKMGRLGLIFECFITEGGVDLVAEYNCGSLEKLEMERFVPQFASLLRKLVGLPSDTLVGDIGLVADEDVA